ncbi:phosphotransferase family protein [Salipiger bermudensis]|uniref:phosphotransferase family protein n=1 Tax=Salipiger bermudensis TaxID=344736 RepID=UPI00300A3A5F
MDQTSDILALLRRLPGWEDRPVEIEPAIAVLASPSWRGVDGAPFIARDTETGDSVFVKRLHEDTGFYIDPVQAFAAAKQAGDVGVGPRVLLSDPAARVLITEHLGEGWRVAGLEHAAEPGFVDRVLETRARFSQAASLAPRADAFAEIESLHTRLVSEGAATPPDMGWLYDTLMLAAERAVDPGETPVAIHGDGNLSNVLFHPSGEIRLVDFDRAGMASPCEEIGTALVEMCAFEAGARTAFLRCAAKAWNLPAEDEVFDRVRLYGIADDLRWAMIAMLMAHLSPRRVEHEFYKFGLWRHVRARASLRDPRFGEKLRICA